MHGVIGKDYRWINKNMISYEKLDIYEMVRSLKEPGIIYDSWHVFDKREILEVSPCIYIGLSFVETSLEK